jgi:hypothetical protein
MPPDFPLPDVDIELIAGWIDANAEWDLKSPMPPAPGGTP